MCGLHCNVLCGGEGGAGDGGAGGARAPAKPHPQVELLRESVNIKRIVWWRAVSLSPDWVQVVVGRLGQIVAVLAHTGDGGDEGDVVPLLHPVTAGSLVISEGVAVIT